MKLTKKNRGLFICPTCGQEKWTTLDSEKIVITNKEIEDSIKVSKRPEHGDYHSTIAFLIAEKLRKVQNEI